MDTISFLSQGLQLKLYNMEYMVISLWMIKES